MIIDFAAARARAELLAAEVHEVELADLPVSPRRTVLDILRDCSAHEDPDIIVQTLVP